MSVDRKSITIETGKGRNIAVTKFYSNSSTGKTLIISSATGVKQRFYSTFANYFAHLGYIVYTFDYWGIGASQGTLNQLRHNTTDLKEWGSIDQSALTGYANKEYPKNEIILLAHSIGGQITGFNVKYNLIDKLILVAAQNGHWRYFKGWGKLKMWLFWYVVLPWPTKIFGYFPAKVFGLFENLPKNMALEWCDWGKQRDYLMHFYDQDTYFFDQMKIPLLAFSFPKDPFAPKAAVAWLTKQFKNADISSIHYLPKRGERQRIGHFGFFREAYKDSLWKNTETWINNS